MRALLVAVIAAVATVTSTPWVALAQAAPGIRSGHLTTLAQAQPMPGMSQPMEHPTASPPFYRERTFLVVTGIAITATGVVVYRVARSWRRRRPAPQLRERGGVVVDRSIHRLATIATAGDGRGCPARPVLVIARSRALHRHRNSCPRPFRRSGPCGDRHRPVEELDRRGSPRPVAGAAGIKLQQILLDAPGAPGAVINKAFGSGSRDCRVGGGRSHELPAQSSSRQKPGKGARFPSSAASLKLLGPSSLRGSLGGPG
jgi:hypothetical protein